MNGRGGGAYNVGVDAGAGAVLYAQTHGGEVAEHLERSGYEWVRESGREGGCEREREGGREGGCEREGEGGWEGEGVKLPNTCG